MVHGNIAYFSTEYNVYSFELPDKWTKLPQCPHRDSGLAIINEQLIAIGGYYSWNTTNTLLSLKKKLLLKSKLIWSKWEQLFSPMPTARIHPAAVTTPTHLVVVGGRISLFGTPLSTVEVMNIKTLQWSTASSLPQAVYYPRVTLCDGRLYLTHNDNTVFSCSTKGLLQSSNEPLSTDSSNGGSVWTRLANIPVHHTSSLVTLRGRVLAITSENCNGRLTGSIHCYNKATNSWSIIGETPTPKSHVLTAVLPTNELVVVGGDGGLLAHRTDTEIGKVVS